MLEFKLGCYTCIRGAAKDAMQHTLGLVKTHLPEADLDPVGDGIPDHDDDPAVDPTRRQRPGHLKQQGYC